MICLKDQALGGSAGGSSEWGVGRMNDQQILDELVALLEATGVKLRSEPLGGEGGGLCTVRGEQVFFLDSQAFSVETAARCARALVELVDIETLYIRPEVRRFVEAHTASQN